MKLSIVYQYLTTLILSKKSYILTSFLASISIGTIIDMLKEHASEESTMLAITIFAIVVMLTGLFIVFDFITGVVASRHKGFKINSSKWGVTIGKFFGLTLYSVLAGIILLLLSSNYIAMVLVFGPVILTLLKEYISIGENLEKRFGKKAYMFTVLDRLFDIIELKFFQTMENKLFSDDNSPEEENEEDPLDGQTSQEEN